MRNRFVLAIGLPLLVALGIGELGAAAATPDENPAGNTGALKAQVATGGSYDAHSGNATRIVTDLHVPGALGVYGLDFVRYWNSLHPDHDDPEAVWPMDFGVSGWSHSWAWIAAYSEDDVQLAELGGTAGEQIWTTTITITFPDGHATKYKITRSNVWHGEPWPVYGHSGPPYQAFRGERNWPTPGGLHDHLGDMAENGSDFWLHRADGGSVHFTGGPIFYEATEIFDPHGLRTDLIYENGYLRQVKQEGGRWLTITWKSVPKLVSRVIEKVEIGRSRRVAACHLLLQSRCRCDRGSLCPGQGNL